MLLNMWLFSVCVAIYCWSIIRLYVCIKEQWLLFNRTDMAEIGSIKIHCLASMGYVYAEFVCWNEIYSQLSKQNKLRIKQLAYISWTALASKIADLSVCAVICPQEGAEAAEMYTQLPCHFHLLREN